MVVESKRRDENIVEKQERCQRAMFVGRSPFSVLRIEIGSGVFNQADAETPWLQGEVVVKVGRKHEQRDDGRR